MRKIFFTVILINGLFFSACQKDRENPVLTCLTPQEIIVPSELKDLIISGESIAIDSFLRVSWLPAVYSLNGLKPVYFVQLDLKTDDFANPAILATTADSTIIISFEQIDTVIKAMDTLGAGATIVQMRIQSNIADEVIEYSRDISFNVFPFEEPPPPSDTIYLVGDATSAGWDNMKGLPVIGNDTNSIYTITAQLDSGGMRLIMIPGKWAPGWGDNGTLNGKLKFRADEPSPEPDEIPSPGQGNYKLNVDLEKLTYAFAKVN